jgi:polar amino acid transport system permease protein
MTTEVLAYVGSRFLLDGAVLAIEIATVSMLFGLVLGLGLALLRISRHAVLQGPAWCYIWFIRGTPLLLQLVFIYDVLPAIGIRLDTFTTAVIGFSLNEAAFSAEIIRGGILSVNRSQSVAAAALGMPGWLTLRRIVMPQAMRAILPGIANQAISMIKSTSIASVILVNELTFRAEQIVGQNFKFFTVFTAAALIYLAMTSCVALGQIAAERRFDFLRDDREGFWAKLMAAAGWQRPVAAPTAAASCASGREALPALITELCSGTSSANGKPVIVCRNVQKAYGAREVLKSIDLTVSRGEVVVIMGPSGSGKSTLLRMINHLEPLDWGEITVEGRHVGYERAPGGGMRPAGNLARARAEARIGMVFQHFNLFEHLTALENLTEAPIRVYQQPADRARTTGMRLLAGVGLAGHAENLPHRLSGGQQQRVAIARRGSCCSTSRPRHSILSSLPRCWA